MRLSEKACVANSGNAIGNLCRDSFYNVKCNNRKQYLFRNGRDNHYRKLVRYRGSLTCGHGGI